MTSKCLIGFSVLYFLLAGKALSFADEDGDGEDLRDADFPRIVATRVDDGPVIDGEILAEEVWALAVPATEFSQTNPIEGAPPSERTEVRIVYTENTIYIGAVCYDSNPSGIIISDSRRDASLEDTDAFQVILDTYRDKQNGFLFGTNPAGMEYDAQITNEGESGDNRAGGGAGINVNWDASWDVRAQITETGWSAEIAIPFRTIRFASSAEQIWGVNFQRNIRRNNETLFWAGLPRQYGIQKVSLAGELRGLQNITQTNLKVLPYSLGSVSEDFSPDRNTNFRQEIGVDAKYSLTPGLTLDATYNTDFAQVEVDEQQINLDRFSLFFPEKRPFFLENAGFFTVGSPREVELFFTRKIGLAKGAEVPIITGGRLSGKAAGINVGLLTMQTKAQRFVDGQGVAPDTVLIPENNFSVVRVNQEFPNRSALGVIFVNRQGFGRFAADRDYNRTLGIDGRWGLGAYGRLAGYFARTITPGETGTDNAFKLAANYNAPALELGAGFTQVGDNFNPEVGFLTRSGYRRFEASIFNRTRPKDFLGFLEIRPHTSYSGFWNFEGKQESGFWHIDTHWEWKSGYEIHTGVNFTREGVTEDFEIFPGDSVRIGTYDHAEAAFLFNTNPGAWWYTSMEIVSGGFFGGDRLTLSPSFRVRLGDAFNVEASLQHNNIDLPAFSFITNLLRIRGSYSFTPRLFVQGLLQYNDRDDLWAANVRLGWLQAANTGLFLVYQETQEEELGRFNTTFRKFIVKYSRLFDLLN